MNDIKSEKPLFTLTVSEFIELNRRLLAEAQSCQPNITPKQSEIMDVKETCRFLSLSFPGIYCLTSNRKIPHYKRGKKLYFKRSELIQWLSEGKKMTVNENANEH